MADDSSKIVLNKYLESLNVNISSDDLQKAFQGTRYDQQKLEQLLIIILKGKGNIQGYLEIYKSLAVSYGNFVALLKLLETVTEEQQNFHDKQGERMNSSTDIINDSSSSSKLIQLTKKNRKSLKDHNMELHIDRSYTFWSFNEFSDLTPFKNKLALDVPFSSQERIICSELLTSFVGIKSELISSNTVLSRPGHLELSVSNEVVETLRDLAQEIIPLGSYYTHIQAFTQYAATPEKGQVLNALAGATYSILNDYYLSITQLEAMHKHKKLSLHKLIYFLRPIMNSMEKISEMLVHIQNTGSRGGTVLTQLYDRVTTLTGDEDTQKMFKYLTKISALPYIEMLKLWISKGVIYDPEEEFFITDNHCGKQTGLYQVNYWDSRYVIQESKMPKLFHSFSDKILRTGKYLNVIRECGKPLDVEEQIDFNLIHSEQHYVNTLNQAYNFASASLLKLIMEEYDLFGRFFSVKRYFLLQQGDFIAQFMDACEQELSKNVEKVIPMKLENLLELTLRLSSAKHDKYQDNLKTNLLPYTLLTQMTRLLNNNINDMDDTSELTGIDAFAFGYEVDWPMSIVFNNVGVIAKYQMIFRELFYFKHVERLLHRLWTLSKNEEKSDGFKSDTYRSAFTLRQRMMNAVQNIEYYLMIEVIEPTWHTFYEKLKKVKNIDDVLVHHQEFLDFCLKNCMLTEPDLLKSILDICNLCIEFCEFINVEQERKLDQSFQERVNKFSVQFTTKILALLRHINDISSQNPSDTKFINLVHRINFNAFYSDRGENILNIE